MPVQRLCKDATHQLRMTDIWADPGLMPTQLEREAMLLLKGQPRGDITFQEARRIFHLN